MKEHIRKNIYNVNGNERESNIELLRIVSIMLVVFSHFCVHSQFSFNTDTLSFNQLMVQFGGVGEIGVSVFIIITGFFSADKGTSLKKTVSIGLEVWLYNIIVLCCVAILRGNINIEILIKHSIPFYNTHWFAYTYICLCILIPFINKFLANIKKSDFQKLLVILFTGWGVIYTFTGADFQFSYLAWFLFLYMLGAYLKMYGSEKPNRVHNLIFLFINLSLLVLSTIMIDIVGLKLGFYPDHGTHFYSLHSPFVLGSAFSLFQLFRGFKIRYNKIINTFAGTTFAIYLISDNMLVRSWLWNDLFNNSEYSNNPFLLFIGLGEVIAICCVCAIIDIGRKHLFTSKLFIKLTQGICGFIEQIYLMIISWVQKLFRGLV